MATHDAGNVYTTLNIRSFKVHSTMCTELMKLVDRISRLFPEMEAARPRSESGSHAFSSLNSAIQKAKLLLQYCSESSKLYLALTGDAILLRCTKSRNLLEQSLRQIQYMLPVILSVEISQIIDDLSAATFLLDPCEEEAGKVIRETIQKGSSTSDATESSEVKAFQLATLRLHITSPKAILIEKSSIKKLLDKVGETELRKRKILTYFLYLFKKYGNFIIADQQESAPASNQSSFAVEYSSNASLAYQSLEVEPHIKYRQYGGESNMLGKAVPPEEFLCPISLRLMYDPVIIASGQTYERMWIQKWFDEGYATCPMTGMKLTLFSLFPNVTMKELISRWCAQNGVVISDPRAEPEVLCVWDTSCNSTASLGSSMNDLCLQMDFSNMSHESRDPSFSSDCLRTKSAYDSSLVQNDHSPDKFQCHSNIPEADLEFLSKLGELCWDSQRKVVEDVKNTLKCNDKACYYLTSENFIEPLITFWRDARDSNDINAQRDGFQLLLTFLNKNRNGILFLREDAFDLLASYLDSEVTEDVFAIMEVLSGSTDCRSKIIASGALVSILRALESEIRGFREQAIKILYNLSSNHDICSQIVSFECISKLVPLMRDEDFAGKCLFIMKNLCNTHEGRTSIAETRGCIASIAEVLESGSSEEQEYAVDILLSLCSQCVQYCHLVMEEGIVPPLVSISVNGNNRAKASASELLRQLRDVGNEPEPQPAIDLELPRASSEHDNEKKSSKSSGFSGRKISMFSKTR